MADKAINMKAHEVRALQLGRKTQTRRAAAIEWREGAIPNFTGWHAERCGSLAWQLVGGMGIGAKLKTQYAKGDRLWVREAWAPEGVDAEEGFYRPDYRATANGQPTDGRWRSPIHMPRWASRLTLIVTDVRVQRLQDISEDDAIAEGIERTSGSITTYCDYEDYPDDPYEWFSRPTASFRTLWNSLHGPDAWNANPWVAAYTFSVHRCNIDQMEAQG